jgi:hypothetical protein
MADKVPANSPAGYIAQPVLFLHRFLDAVLTDIGQACGERRANRIGSEAFRHGDDRDRLRRAPRNLGSHLGQTLREGLETHSHSI